MGANIAKRLVNEDGSPACDMPLVHTPADTVPGTLQAPASTGKQAGRQAGRQEGVGRWASGAAEGEAVLFVSSIGMHEYKWSSPKGATRFWNNLVTLPRVMVISLDGIGVDWRSCVPRDP